MLFTRARIKLTLLLVAIFAVLYVLAAVSIYTVTERLTMRELNIQLRSESFALARRAVLFLEGRSAMPMRLLSEHSFSALSRRPLIVIRNPQGAMVYADNHSLATHLPFSAAQTPHNVTFATDYIRSFHMYTLVLTIRLRSASGSVPGYVQFVININRDMALLKRLLSVLWWVGAGGVVAATGAFFIASERVLRPIRRSWERQQQFVADASHELRTPLAVIQANLDIVLGHANQDVMDNLEWINHAKSESRRLVRLTGDLLTLAKADSHQTLIAHELVRLDAIVRDVFDMLQVFAEAKGIGMHVDIQSDEAMSGQTARATPDLPEEGDGGHEGDAEVAISVWGDSERLHQLCVILINNAIQYTQEGEIRIRLVRMRQSAVRLEVEDTGMGIEPHDLPRIFDRFYRAEKSRSRGGAGAGAGLGLAIAKWIVESHHGRLDVDSKVGRGTVFRVILPADRKRDA
ncbi:MAG: sensor histidine kinase [Bacilli bacterium]